MQQAGSDFGRTSGLLAWVLDFLKRIDCKELVSPEGVALVVPVAEKVEVNLRDSRQPELLISVQNMQ